MAKTFDRTFTAAEWRLLENDLEDPIDWINKAIDGKLYSCSKRMTNEALRILGEDPSIDTIPSTSDKLILALVKHPSYRNRKQRKADDDAAEKTQKDAAEAAIKEQEKRAEQERKDREKTRKEETEANEKSQQERIDAAVEKALNSGKKKKEGIE